jgi:hypothetical protein
MTTSSTRDPRRDCQEIARHLATVVFPWDTTRALELALFRTFASARIGGLLHGTGEFETRTGKRYDDTDLIISEIIENGFDSPRGARAIARMNALHGRFRIANEDFLYVLSTFVLEPIRWNRRFGWRCMTESEKAGLVLVLAAGRRTHADSRPARQPCRLRTFQRRLRSSEFPLHDGQPRASRWPPASCLPAGFPCPCAPSSATAFTPCLIRHCARRSTCAAAALAGVGRRTCLARALPGASLATATSAPAAAHADSACRLSTGIPHRIPRTTAIW